MAKTVQLWNNLGSRHRSSISTRSGSFRCSLRTELGGRRAGQRRTMTNHDEQPDGNGHIPDASPGTRSPLQPTGRQTTKTPTSHTPIAPSSAKHAKLLLERSTAPPLKRFDSADYFLSQCNDHQTAEAARVAMSAVRILSLDPHLSQLPPPHTSARFPVLRQWEPCSPSHLTVAHSCKVARSA